MLITLITQVPDRYKITALKRRVSDFEREDVYLEMRPEYVKTETGGRGWSWTPTGREAALEKEVQKANMDWTRKAWVRSITDAASAEDALKQYTQVVACHAFFVQDDCYAALLTKLGIKS